MIPTGRTIALIALSHLAGCETGTAHRIEVAHGKSAWIEKDAVACDITVTFGSGVLLAGSMIYQPGNGRVRIETDAGATLVFDGERAWVSPSAAQVPMIRFQLRESASPRPLD